MGDVKKWVNAGGLWDPAGSANRVAVQNSSHPIGGSVGKWEDQQQNKSINLHNTLDPGGGLRESTTGIKGSANPLGPAQPAAPFNPNGPGSIFNMQHNGGPYTPPPPAGSYTNGLGQNPQQNGQQPNWQAIIANALRGPGVPNNRPPMPQPGQQPGIQPTQQTIQPLQGQPRAWS